jgi:hypothetical protein
MLPDMMVAVLVTPADDATRPGHDFDVQVFTSIEAAKERADQRCWGDFPVPHKPMKWEDGMKCSSMLDTCVDARGAYIAQNADLVSTNHPVLLGRNYEDRSDAWKVGVMIFPEGILVAFPEEYPDGAIFTFDDIPSGLRA